MATVHDGSTGEMHPGYWLCDITGAEMNSSEIVPLYQKMYSAEAKEFVSENAEVLAGIDLVRSQTQGRGIWAVDRGGDRKKLLEPLLDRHERFVIRSTGKRLVVDRENIKRSVAELGASAGCVSKRGSSKFRTGRRRPTICAMASSRFVWWDVTNGCTWWRSLDSERNPYYCSRMRWRERGTRNRSGGSRKSIWCAGKLRRLFALSKEL